MLIYVNISLIRERGYKLFKILVRMRLLFCYKIVFMVLVLIVVWLFGFWGGVKSLVNIIYKLFCEVK